MISKTIEKLRDPEYRKAFIASQINIGVPFQIRGLLQSRGWKQEDLVKRTGMLQPRISALLTPGKVRPNIETLRRIAEAFDCGLEVRFVSFGELIYRSENFDPENFRIPTFDDEIKQAEKLKNAEVQALTRSSYSSIESGTALLFSMYRNSQVNGQAYLIRSASDGKVEIANIPPSDAVRYRFEGDAPTEVID